MSLSLSCLCPCPCPCLCLCLRLRIRLHLSLCSLCLRLVLGLRLLILSKTSFGIRLYIWQAALRWWSCIGLPLSISFSYPQQALEVAQNLLKRVRSDEVRVVTLSCLVSGLSLFLSCLVSLCLCRVVSCRSVVLSCQVLSSLFVVSRNLPSRPPVSFWN